MKKFTLQLIAIVIVFMVSGCRFNKMIDNASLIDYNVNPSPLEMHADSVNLEITVTFPPKFFHKKAYMILTPTLQSSDKTNEYPFKSKTLQGEKVKDNNETVIFKTGEIKDNNSTKRSYVYSSKIPYDKAFRMSDLELKINARKGVNGKEVTFASVKIADGIITTPELVDEGLKVDNGTQAGTNNGLMRTVTSSVELPKSRMEKQTLTLYYPMQKDQLTSKEKRKIEIEEFLTDVKNAKSNSDINFKDITIASYASPDGPVDMNSNLVKGRGNNSDKFLTSKFKKAKVVGAENTNFMNRKTTDAEDWVGFKKAVEASNIADKNAILNILSRYSDGEAREREIKNMAMVYDELRNSVLPQLRRSEIIATYETRQKTQQEIINLSKTKTEALTQVELFYGAQTATGGDKEIIYKTYTQKYASDWRGFNNLGVYYISNNQLDDAEAQLQKAESLEANNASILNNMGALYWARGDYDKAAEYFKNASKINPSDNINYNLGVICIKKGNYESAVAKFGSTPSFNKSLAQTLSGDNSAAMATMKNVTSEEAYVAYLKAVEAARDNNAGEVFSNLKTAVAKDASLKLYAQNDIEFLRYFEDETFKSIVK